MPSVALVPQPQERPLGEASIANIENLGKLSTNSVKELDKHLQNVLKHATSVAGEINEIGHRKRARHLKKKSRLAGQNQELSEDEVEEFESFQKEVDVKTKELDLGTRKVIDDSIWLQDVPVVVNHVLQKSRSYIDQITQDSDVDDEDDRNGSQGRRSRLILSRPDEAETPTALLHAALTTRETSWKSRTLTERYSENNDYIDFYRAVFHAKHPGDGDTARPMPHAKQWFAAEEGRSARSGPPASSQRQKNSRSVQGSQNMASLQSNEDDDDGGSNDGEADDDVGTSTRAREQDEIEDEDEDDEIQVQSERVRITCPITLRPYENPYRSTKCPHAFEKQYILDFIKNSNEQLPITPAMHQELSQITQTQARSRRERELRPKMVRCPECNIPLTEKDLRPDPVLQRIVKRELERQRRQEEAENRRGGNNGDDTTMDVEMAFDPDGDDNDDNDDDDDQIRGTQRRRGKRKKIIHVGSSPAASRASGRFIKGERLSIVPQTQVQDTYEHVDDFTDDDDDD